VETIVAMLKVTTEFAQNVTFNQKRISRSLPAGHLDATTMADYLVHKVIEESFPSAPIFIMFISKWHALQYFVEPFYCASEIFAAFSLDM
jgi:hypothetical protein